MTMQKCALFILAIFLVAAHGQTVQDIIKQKGCSTAPMSGLSGQLVVALNCLRSGLFRSIHNVKGISLAPSATQVPYLQSPAVSALVCAAERKHTNVTVNSALRTLPQQLALYQWYLAKLCGISLAAKPGQSNHESGLAVDIQNPAAWKADMEACHWKKLGDQDPVHYDYVGQGGVDIRQLSVRAFQRLWNVNNPQDKIAEDGIYGPATEARLLRSPVKGFSKNIC